MPLYRYTNNTKQLGVDHTNHVVALKIDLAGSPVFTVLAESQAAANGSFTLEWGAAADPATEDWAGRVVIAAVDDNGAVELDVVAHDWLTGTLISVGSNDYLSVVSRFGALHLWEMDEVSGTWLDTIGSVDAAVTGAPTYQEAVPDQDSFGVLTSSAYSRPTTALDITGGVVAIAMMVKFTDTGANECFWGLGDNSTECIYCWYDPVSNSFGIGGGGLLDVFGIANADTILANGKWHCVIVETPVNDYVNTKIWVDGLPQTVGVQTNTPANRNWNGKFGIAASAQTSSGLRYLKNFHRLTYIKGTITDREALQITIGAMTGYIDTAINVLDLILSCSFDARAGGAAADIYSENNGVVGTIAGSATFIEGKIEESYNPTASSQYISFPDSVDYAFAGAFSISLWIKTTGTGDAIIIEKDTSTGWSLQLYSSPAGVLRMFTGGAETRTNESVNDGSWHHITVTQSGAYNSGSTKIYIDKIEATYALTNAATPAYSTAPLYISGRGTLFPINGELDSVRLYDAVLNTTEIISLFNESGLIVIKSNYDIYVKNTGASHYYKLDEISGTIIEDSSGTIDGVSLIPVTTRGQIAKGLPATSMDFDGTSQAINMNSTIAVKADFNTPNNWASVFWIETDQIGAVTVLKEIGNASDYAAAFNLRVSGVIRSDRSTSGYVGTVGVLTVGKPRLLVYSEVDAARNFYFDGKFDSTSARGAYTAAECDETVIGAQRLGAGQGYKFNGKMSSVSFHTTKIGLREVERIWAVGRIGKIVSWAEGDLSTLQDSMALTIDNTVFTKNTASAVFSRGWSDIYINNNESFYAEVVFTTLASNLDMTVGVSNSNTKTAFNVAGAYVYRTNGFLYTSGDGGVDVSKPAVQGDRLGIAYKNGSMWFRLNGGAWFSGDPETDTSPSITGITGDLYFYVCANNGTNQPVTTVAFGKALLTDATPTNIEEGYYFSGYDEYIPLIAQNAWLMNEASGSLIDHIGDQDVAFTGTPTYEQASIEARDKAIDFNDAYCTATVDVSSGVITLFGLIKFDSTTNNQVILGLGSVSGDSNNLYYMQTTNTFGFNTWNTDVFGISNATSGPADGSWHFVIAEFHTSDFASNLLWIDDVSQSISQVAGTSLNHALSSNLGIGWNGFSGSSQEFEGLLSRVGFMNRATTAEERSNLYQLAIGNII